MSWYKRICKNELFIFLFGIAKGGVMAFICYLIVHHGSKASGTLALVPCSDILVCMLIYGLGYSICIGRLDVLRRQLKMNKNN